MTTKYVHTNLSPDDRIDNAFAEFRALPWYRRWWAWLIG